MMVRIRRTWPAVSVITREFCCSMAVTEPYEATMVASRSARGLAMAMSRGRTTVMISLSPTCAGSSPTKTGMSSRCISSSFWR
ncbi:MAG: hypothetical protein ACYSW2_17185 [Planctomycetota bacterium]